MATTALKILASADMLVLKKTQWLLHYLNLHQSSKCIKSYENKPPMIYAGHKRQGYFI